MTDADAGDGESDVDLLAVARRAVGSTPVSDAGLGAALNDSEVERNVPLAGDGEATRTPLG